MSKRERFILTMVGVVIGGALLYSVVLDKLLAQRASLVEKITKAKDDLVADEDKIKRQPANQAKWTARVNQSFQRDSSDAEAQVLQSLVDFCRQLELWNIGWRAGTAQPLLVAKAGSKGVAQKSPDFMKLTCRVEQVGSMFQIGKFVYLIQRSSVPVRITELSMTPIKEDTDDFKVIVGLSTIFLGDTSRSGASGATGTTRPTTSVAVDPQAPVGSGGRSVPQQQPGAGRAGGPGGRGTVAATPAAPASDP
jgi:hypothetical protein